MFSVKITELPEFSPPLGQEIILPIVEDETQRNGNYIPTRCISIEKLIEYLFTEVSKNKEVQAIRMKDGFTIRSIKK